MRNMVLSMRLWNPLEAIVAFIVDFGFTATSGHSVNLVVAMDLALRLSYSSRSCIAKEPINLLSMFVQCWKALVHPLLPSKAVTYVAICYCTLSTGLKSEIRRSF